MEDEDEFEDWLDMNWERLFKIELEAWYTDPALWPKSRTEGFQIIVPIRTLNNALLFILLYKTTRCFVKFSHGSPNFADFKGLAR